MTGTRFTYQLLGYYVALLVSLCILHVANSECNSCAVGSEQACVSETEFRVCANGAMIGDVYRCPNETVCTMTGSCQKNGNNVIAPCAVCDECDVTKTFVCKGPKQFALCLGTERASDIVGECADGYVCNTAFRYICGAIDEGYGPSCSPTTEAPVTESTSTSTSTTTSTTPSPSAQPTVYCNFVKQRGRFPVGIDLTTTCKQYLLCMQRNDIWIGAIYYCPNNLYFDDSTRACNRNTPPRCNSRIRSLSLLDISLT